MKRRLRQIWSWKFVFYELLLPVLRGLGPARGDAILGLLGFLADGDASESQATAPRGARARQ